MPAQSEVTSFCVLPRPKKRHTHDSFSVCSLVSDGFRLKTPLSNQCMRNLPGLKPRLRFLDRANRGHVILRHSAFFRGQKKTHPRFLFRVFRVFRGERCFRLKTPLSNTCMRKLPGLKPRLRFLDRGATNARAKRGHVILRHSAFFCGQKKTHPRFLFRVFRVFRG